jgi:hypothetical protein
MQSVCLLCLESHTGVSDSDVEYQARGFFNGTSHYAYIHNGVYTNDKSNKTIKLTSTQQAKLARILQNYKRLFHKVRDEDKPHGGDRGTARFVYDELYGHPDEMPDLARFFLNLDGNLGRSPGSLRVNSLGE